MVPPEKLKSLSYQAVGFRITPIPADRAYVNTLIFVAIGGRAQNYVESTTAAIGEMR